MGIVRQVPLSLLRIFNTNDDYSECKCQQKASLLRMARKAYLLEHRLSCKLFVYNSCSKSDHGKSAIYCLRCPSKPKQFLSLINFLSNLLSCEKYFFKCLTFLTDFDLNIFSLFAFGISKSDLIVSIEVTRSFCRFKAGGNFFVPRAFAEQHTVSRRATNSRNTEFIVPRFVLFTTFYGREIENDETMTYKKRILDLTFCSVTNDYIMINKNSTILSTEIFLYCVSTSKKFFTFFLLK